MQETQEIGSTPGPGRFLGGGNGNPLQYSCLESPMAEEPGGIRGIAKSQTWLTTAQEQQQHGYHKGKGWGGINWETGIDICTLGYIK